MGGPNDLWFRGSSETRSVSKQVGTAVGLDDDAYGRLVRAASTDRREIVVRLAGEAGLRPSEIARLRPDDVESRTRDGTTNFVVRLDQDDGTRYAYLPPDLEAAISAYAASTGCDGAEPIVDVSPRRIQMIVRETADRAAAEMDAPELGAVSTRELRRYHARCLLDRGVDPRIVTEVTAWNRLEPLAEPPGPPDLETMLASIDRATRGAGDGGGSSPERGRPSARDAHRHRVVELVDSVVRLGEALSGASTRETIEQEACDALVPLYEYAWIASEMGSDGLHVRARSTDGDVVAADPIEAPPGRACLEVYESGEPAVVAGESLPFVDPGEEFARAIVPIEQASTTYGVLEVGIRSGPETVPDREQRVLQDLGRRLGQSIAAVERRRLLHADTVLSLSFKFTDQRSIFVRLSAAFDCSLTLTGVVPGENGSLLTFVWLEGASPDDVFQRATDMDAVDSARLIRSAEDGALLEFVVTDDSPALTLVECGGSLTELTASDGRGTMTAEFVPDVDVREVVESVGEAFPNSEMITKREVERSVQTDTEFRQALDDTLTTKQRSSLRAAYLSGYFDWPRGSTAEELADSLGVSSPTFHNHLRRAQRKILATYLDDGGP